MALVNGNTPVTLLASAARTATVSTAAQNADYATGVIVYLDVTAASGTGGLTLTVEGQDPASAKWMAVNSNPTAVTTTGTRSYLVALSASGGAATQATSAHVPNPWRVTVTHGDASSYTYTVGAIVLV